MHHEQPFSTKLDDYEQAIFTALINARDIQDFLWAEESWARKPFLPDTWSPLFQKRVDCIKELQTNKESWKVEARKRLLQQASLSIKALVALRNASGAREGLS